MNTVIMLNTLVNSFAWLMIAVSCATAIAYLLSTQIASLITVDFSDCEEKFAAEDASLLAEISRCYALAARCEAYSALAVYCPIWASEPRVVRNLSFLRSADAFTLESLKGIGARRSRRILDAGDSLTELRLWKICGSRVAHNLLWQESLAQQAQGSV